MAIKTPAGLTIKQKLFIEHYLTCNHAEQAAIAAGYTPKTAKQQGYRLLTYATVRAEIDRRTSKKFDELELTADNILRHQAAMGMSNIMDYIDIDARGNPSVNLGKCTRDQAAAIKSIKITSLAPMQIVENGQELQREVISTELTLWDKPSVGRVLMAHKGLAVPSAGNTTNVQINNFQGKDPLEVVKAVAFMLSDPKLKGPVIEQDPVKKD